MTIIEVLRKLGGYSLKLVHVLFLIYATVAPYITDNFNGLMFLVIVYMFVMTQWYMFGECILTTVEDSLLGVSSKNYKDGSKKSFIVVFFNSLGITDKAFYYLIIFVVLFNFLFCLYKIYTQNLECKNQKKTQNK